MEKIYVVKEDFMIDGYVDGRKSADQAFENLVQACLHFASRMTVAKLVARENGFDSFTEDVEPKNCKRFYACRADDPHNNVIKVELFEMDVHHSDESEISPLFYEALTCRFSEDENLNKSDYIKFLVDEFFIDVKSAERITEDFLIEARWLKTKYVKGLSTSYVHKYLNKEVYISYDIRSELRKELARKIGIPDYEIEACIIYRLAGTTDWNISPADIYVVENDHIVKIVSWSNMERVCLSSACDSLAARTTDCCEVSDRTKALIGRLFATLKICSDVFTEKTDNNYADRLADEIGTDEVFDEIGTDEVLTPDDSDDTVVPEEILEDKAKEYKVSEGVVNDRVYPKPLSKEDIKMVEEYLNSDKTRQEIAKKYEVSESVVGDRIKRYKKEHPEAKKYRVYPKPLSKEDIKMVEEYLNTDKTHQEIAKKYEVSESVVCDRIYRYKEEHPEAEKKIKRGRGPSGQRPLSKEDIKMVEEYLNSDKTRQKICKKYKVSDSVLTIRVRRYKKEHPEAEKITKKKGCPRGQKPMSKKDLKMVEEYLNTNKTRQEIAKKYGVSKSTVDNKVSRYRKEYGVT